MLVLMGPPIWKNGLSNHHSASNMFSTIISGHMTFVTNISKFSNLSNWKEEAWKNQGFNGIRTRDLRDTGAMLYQLSYEFTAMVILYFDLQPQFNIWIISYILHIISLLTGDMNSINWPRSQCVAS